MDSSVNVFQSGVFQKRAGSTMLQAFEGAVNDILQNARETVGTWAVLDVGMYGLSTTY